MTGDVMEEYAEKNLLDWTGSLCELRTHDNQLLLAGVIRGGDGEHGEIRVVSQRGKTVPQGVVFHTEVKAQVHAAGGRVVMLYGRITGSGKRFFRVEVQNIITCLERREAFRQPTHAEAAVRRVQDGQLEKSGAPCRLVDISVTGVCFQSREQYAVGEELLLENIQFLEQGKRHDFFCRVVRCEQIEGEPLRRYGCGFLRLRSWQEERLFHDILALQASAMRLEGDTEERPDR